MHSPYISLVGASAFLVCRFCSACNAYINAIISHFLQQADKVQTENDGTLCHDKLLKPGILSDLSHPVSALRLLSLLIWEPSQLSGDTDTIAIALTARGSSPSPTMAFAKTLAFELISLSSSPNDCRRSSGRDT